MNIFKLFNLYIELLNKWKKIKVTYKNNLLILNNFFIFFSIIFLLIFQEPNKILKDSIFEDAYYILSFQLNSCFFILFYFILFWVFHLLRKSTNSFQLFVFPIFLKVSTFLMKMIFIFLCENKFCFLFFLMCGSNKLIFIK